MTHSTQFNLPSSLSVELDDDVAVLCLSRSEKRNAIEVIAEDRAAERDEEKLTGQ